MRRSGLIAVVLLGAASAAHAQRPAACAVARENAVVVYGDVERTATFTADSLARMPAKSFAGEPHGGTPGTYTGPTLSELLKGAGAPSGGDLRGSAMAVVVIAEAADGYTAAFSIAEVDPTFREVVPFLAIRKDGAPLDAEVGPFQIIVPDDSRHGRWVRQVACLRVVRAPASR
jgi:hypothetical protein